MKMLLSKYKSLRLEVKAAVWFMFCGFLQKGIAFFTVPLFTRLMSTEQYGTYSLYLSWLQIFTVISSLYLYQGVTDNAMAKFSHDRSRFISSMQGLTISITTVVGLAVFALGQRAEDLFGLTPVMLVLLFIEVYVTPALFFWTARTRFEYRYKALVAVTVLKSLLNPLLGLIAVSISQQKDLGRMISTTAVEVLFCGGLLISQFVKGKAFFHRTYWKYGLRLGVPMLPHYLSGIILNHGDRIMISKLVGTSEVALYGVAYSIGMLVQLFVTSINSALTPWIYGRLKEADIRAIQIRSRAVLLLVFGIAGGLMLVSPELVYIFGSNKYAASVNVIPPVAGSVFFIFLYGFLSFPEFYYEKTSFLMIASIAAAALNVILNFIFIPKFGFVAAAYTTLACYALYSLGHYLIGGRILQNETGYRAIVQESLMFTLSILTIVLCIVAQYFFAFPVLRYVLIGLGLVIMFVLRAKIIALFKRNF